MTLQTGLKPEAAAKIADSLLEILAASQQTYALTQNVHWNITGPLFHSVHVMTEEHYLELATAIDDIAERVRALNVIVPFASNTSACLTIDANFEATAAEDKVGALVKAHENLATLCRAAIANAADDADEVTAGLLTDRLTVHEKTAWMLRALVA